MATQWTDQPAVLENAESIAVIALDNGRIAQILRRPVAAWVEWYVTVGNLFGSQTVRVRDLEGAVRLIDSVSQADDEDVVDLKAHHAILVPGEA
ncbi:MAG: hypothetical protein ACYTGV_16575 [Planctomycetota bacterium]|jgi:hypothetical protein